MVWASDYAARVYVLSCAETATPAMSLELQGSAPVLTQQDSSNDEKIYGGTQL